MSTTQTADVPLSMLPFFRFLNAEGKRSIMKQLVDQFQSTSITPSSTAQAGAAGLAWQAGNDAAGGAGRRADGDGGRRGRDQVDGGSGRRLDTVRLPRRLSARRCSPAEAWPPGQDASTWS